MTDPEPEGSFRQRTRNASAPSIRWSNSAISSLAVRFATRSEHTRVCRGL